MLQQFHAEQNLAYDESMIEYYGRNGMKQCIKRKPVPFGLKVWSLCRPSGYMANFEIYQGKNPRSKTLYEESYGKCIAPLFNMIDDFDDHIRALPFSFFFDNLFIGIPALLQLNHSGTTAQAPLEKIDCRTAVRWKRKRRTLRNLDVVSWTARASRDKIFTLQNGSTIQSLVSHRLGTEWIQYRRHFDIRQLNIKKLKCHELLSSPNIINTWAVLIVWTRTFRCTELEYMARNGIVAFLRGW